MQKETMDSAVNQFASSVFGSDKANGEGEDPEVRNRHLEIIEKLIANFDLEETESRYRSLNSCEFAVDQRSFSIDCELEANRSRERLVKLMGTNLVRLNDHAYMTRLKHQLKHEYDTRMDKLEKERAEAEEQRIHRLILEGKIRHHEDADHNYAKTKKKQPKRRNPSRKICTRKSYSAGAVRHRMRGSHASMETVPEERRKPNNKSNSRAHSAPMTSRLSCSTPQTMVSRLQENDDESESYSVNGVEDTDNDANSVENDSILHKMHREKTVNGLYKLAEEFLCSSAKSTTTST